MYLYRHHFRYVQLQSKEVAERAKKILNLEAKLKKRPERIRELGERFTNYFKHNDPIHLVPPPGMYGQVEIEEWIEYDGVLTWLTNEWLDVTILSWWAL